jgi:acylpyruvate hydrolase
MIYGIGRNYADHAKELGNAVPQTVPPVFFKPDAAAVLSGETVTLPPFSKNVHYEVELAFRFGAALEISEVCVANDLTARDKQKEAQDTKGPWGMAKGFKQSCGLGNWVSAAGVDFTSLELKMHLNGKLVQRGFTRDMIFGVTALAEFLKAHFPVQPGDIVLTGTPSGVGPLKTGDRLQAELVGLSRGEWFFK